MGSTLLFLDMWPRQPFEASKTMPDDETVEAAVGTILTYESPTLALPHPLRIEYHKALVKAVRHMVRAMPLNAHDLRDDTVQNTHLRNLRYWAYQKAGHDAINQLLSWCERADIEMPVKHPEQAIILVRALRAQCLALGTEGERKLHLKAVVQECVLYLEDMVGLGPTGNAAEQAYRTSDPKDWDDAPWRQFITWLEACLPSGLIL